MPNGLPIAPIILFGGVTVLMLTGFIVGLFHASKRAKARREALATLAADLGCTFDPSNDGSHDDRYDMFSLFSRGHSRAAMNTIQGTVQLGGEPCGCRFGDYTYTETSGSGKNRRSTTYRVSYLLAHLPYLNAPGLSIRREHVFDKIGSMLGFDDIDFESAEFSRKFHVSSTDKRFAYDIVTAAMMEYLLAEGELWTIELKHGILLLTRGMGIWDPGRFRSGLAFVDGFLERWPEHVTRDLRDRMGGN